MCVCDLGVCVRESLIYFKSMIAPAHMLHASMLSLFLLFSVIEQFTVTFRW